jgi:hypothetical protein
MTDEAKTKNEEKLESKVRTFTEELSVAGGQLVERLNELVKQGNIRRLIIKDPTGRTLIEVPLTLGLVGGVGVVFFAPFIAAVGAIAAMVARVSIIIERYEDPMDAESENKTPSVVDVTPADKSEI